MSSATENTEEKFKRVYDRNVKRVYQMSMLYLKNRQDAEDAAQVVFIKYLRSGKVFESTEHEKAWFLRVTSNYCKDVLRGWWRSHRVDIENIPEIHSSQEEKAGILLEKLLELPPKYKAVLYMFYYEDYAVKEIAHILHRNESTVRTQLVKGRELLKIDIGGCYER